MKFGTKYIKYIMMMEETLKMKKGAGNLRKHKNK
jgi:hypothetical protein